MSIDQQTSRLHQRHPLHPLSDLRRGRHLALLHRPRRRFREAGRCRVRASNAADPSGPRQAYGCAAVLHDLAFFHHERNAFGRGDVRGGIARHRDDVGELPFFQRADSLRRCRTSSASTDVAARKASIGAIPKSGHQREFLRVLPVRKNRGIRAEGDLHARFSPRCETSPSAPPRRFAPLPASAGGY